MLEVLRIIAVMLAFLLLMVFSKLLGGLAAIRILHEILGAIMGMETIIVPIALQRLRLILNS